MDGHGVYVWISLLVCLVAILLETLVLRHSRQRAIARIQKLHSIQPRKTQA
ncbi:heme exporter protein CcmD [Comamonas jiangduensis]